MITRNISIRAALVFRGRPRREPRRLADTLAKGVGHFLALGPLYVGLQVVMTTFFITALRTRNERFHAFFAMYAIAWLLIYP